MVGGTWWSELASSPAFPKVGNGTWQLDDSSRPLTSHIQSITRWGFHLLQHCPYPHGPG